LQEVTLPIWTNAECKQKYGAAGESWNCVSIEKVEKSKNLQHLVASSSLCFALDKRRKTAVPEILEVSLWIGMKTCYNKLFLRTFGCEWRKMDASWHRFLGVKIEFRT
jgi:hypothetical protein